MVNTCPAYQKKRYSDTESLLHCHRAQLNHQGEYSAPCGIEVIFEYIARLFSKALWGKMGRSTPVAVLFSAKGFGIYGVL